MSERYLTILVLIALPAASCTKLYAPKAITGSNTYLVVEGTINTAAGDSTTIIISHTVKLTAGVGSVPELKAIVNIQDDQNQSYPLHEIGNGVYKSAELTLDDTRRYRLSIQTSDGKSYLSDYVAAIESPPIDSVGFTINDNGPHPGLQVYVNTHDPNNNTHYYRWDYIETWQFHARYTSNYVLKGNDVVLRPDAEQIYQCWGNSISTDVKVGSSIKLTQDVIYQSPLVFIPSTSEKIERRYSIIIKQYALTADEYNYFNQLKENTEELGGIFDPQPTQLTGNIHCTNDPLLPAIGYVTAGTIQQKRVFIDNSQVPGNWITTYPYDCELDTVKQLNDLIANPGGAVIIAVAIDNDNPPMNVGFLVTAPDCGDCTLRGTTTEPSFWK